MQRIMSPEKGINDLRKEISILEWDIPHIQNEKLKALREDRLTQAKKELKELLEKTKPE